MSCSKHPEATACATCVEERVDAIEAALDELLLVMSSDEQPMGPAAQLSVALAASRERVRAARKGGQ